MPTTYQGCGKDVTDLIVNTMTMHHAELMELGVTISAVFATKEDDDGVQDYALKRNGIPCAAMIKVTPLIDRARGEMDAKLTICSWQWSQMNANHRAALIDHELTHLEVKADKDGNKFDDLNRPRLKLRPHDWELTGFDSVAHRHGENAIEVLSVKRFQADYGQQLGLWP